ncbi:orotate phosphoribosyltransferase [Vagococcus xieshaowenii]|uniref:Orotate phosphoribosyltransferase n=1 Tax=Vagococcus xieshaowenii TaxID=2562451 RepID=A0AAJ5JKX3_9ENTE|nr:orotate phosphoribosyltransferase [Vagococcus xieshaowenii]QCA28597.1 orotate phosphoribosyltransferase [Vagococcus xieshaowenii]TFZ40595.1 orotate phosphoribosyltransferase [Vagococcus xieshaowenii]
MTIAKQTAEHLLEIGAVSLKPTEPFTWASGIKSPIYCDNRVIMGYPSIRKEVAAHLAKLIQEHYPEVEVIAGTATAGIPHAAWIADILELPMVYIRSTAKKHGRGNQIEGVIYEGQKMVIIEDLISTGGSVLEAAQAAENEGANVLGVAAIFTYELADGLRNFREAGVPFVTLTNYSTLITSAIETARIEENQRELLEEWKKNPREWLINN